jgi:hypothetical protein
VLDKTSMTPLLLRVRIQFRRSSPTALDTLKLTVVRLRTHLSVHGYPMPIDNVEEGNASVRDAHASMSGTTKQAR